MPLVPTRVQDIQCLQYLLEYMEIQCLQQLPEYRIYESSSTYQSTWKYSVSCTYQSTGQSQSIAVDEVDELLVPGEEGEGEGDVCNPLDRSQVSGPRQQVQLENVIQEKIKIVIVIVLYQLGIRLCRDFQFCAFRITELHKVQKIEHKHLRPVDLKLS